MERFVKIYLNPIIASSTKVFKFLQPYINLTIRLANYRSCTYNKNNSYTEFRYYSISWESKVVHQL